MNNDQIRIAIAEVPLGNGKVALVDEEDLEKVLAHGAWHSHKQGGTTYAAHEHYIGNGKSVRVVLHRFIMNAAPGAVVAHLNGNGADCRKANLRIANHKLNGASYRTKNKGAASKYRGVYANNGRGKPWAVHIWKDGVSYYFGRYDTEEEAARVYNKHAAEMFGEFAHINPV